ncbi:MAG: sigma-70 family RNA polymerase sigma factor, partial [Terrimesophilobacter sp.]
MTPDLAASFREGFAREWPRVVGATLSAFGDRELAEDSAQEAFLRAHERLSAGEVINNLGAWATTSARRIAIDSLRRDTVLRSKLPLLLPDEATDSDSGSVAIDAHSAAVDA